MSLASQRGCASRMAAFTGAFLALGLVSGCPDSHAFDAGGIDGGVDAGCPDRDGDGATDAACGGADCDDRDARVGPLASRCEGPGSIVSCEGAARALTPCEPGVCDARTGRCAAEACGDGVVHPTERCDDGNAVDGDGCDVDCRYSICVSDADCPAEAPSCSDAEPGVSAFRCRPLQPGAAISERCTSNAQCASGFCDLEQERCSHGCMEHAECGTFEAWCVWPELDIGAGALAGPHRCAYGCMSDEECPDESVCTLPELRMPPRGYAPGFTFCRARNIGGVPYGGESPTYGAGCETLMYTLYTATLEPLVLCSRMCTSNLDCTHPLLPVCDDFAMWPPRPPSWRTAYATRCMDFVR